MPGDLIAFREAGCRATWTLPIERAFRVAVQDAAALHRQQKRRHAATEPTP